MIKCYFFMIVLMFGLLVGSMLVMVFEEGGLLLVGINISDQVLLQCGVKLFFNYCVGCYLLKFMCYLCIGEDLGLFEEEVMKNFNFIGVNFGEMIELYMLVVDVVKWFGKVLLDLLFEVCVKIVDWVYVYFNLFYFDLSCLVGWNNIVFLNVLMLNLLWELQGVQMVVKKDGGEEVEKLELVKLGKMILVEFQQVICDLMNFFEYVFELVVLQCKYYGIWVLLFLVGFIFLVYMFKKEYWKDVY